MRWQGTLPRLSDKAVARMIHIIITCDICASHRDYRASEHNWRGIFDGPEDAAKDAGWRIKGGGHVCPDCHEDAEKIQEEPN